MSEEELITGLWGFDILEEDELEEKRENCLCLRCKQAKEDECTDYWRCEGKCAVCMNPVENYVNFKEREE